MAQLRTKMLEAKDNGVLENMINKYLYDLPEGDFIDIKFSTTTVTYMTDHFVYTALIIYKTN
ncbi:sporulation protein Cse60 [Lysinibacillus parviboronicapiens]|uniref:sporulation protein Cse60 n=1 Tax=Lysinibacillus parviboronicapiens TaxID=436516 RepID=UPI00187D1912|nr:sporulation protein Cse60 [Lysinibacillus parviboronicapiens]